MAAGAGARRRVLAGTGHVIRRYCPARWQADDNDAELAVYPDCIHGFTFFPIELAKRAHERIGKFLDRSFS